MLIGKLYVVPFSKKLVIATSEREGLLIGYKCLRYVSDVHFSDVELVRGRLKLRKSYFGEKNVNCTKEVRENWLRLKSEE